MEQTAEPGTVQIAHDTYRLVRALFEFEPLGPIEVKGKAEPVRAYRVLGRKATPMRPRGIEGLHAEMVGRRAELEVLGRIMDDLQRGVGQIVAVLGEAGLGKTRLISEAHQVFDRLAGPHAAWYDVTTLSYESSQAYGLFQRLIRRATGLTFNDPPDTIRQRLALLVEGLPAESRPHAGHVFEALFGLESNGEGRPLESETFKRELLEAMQAWWRASFASRPTVMAFDDMHWSDAASVDLLCQLLPLTTELPLVIGLALRAERQAPAWQIRSTAAEEYHHRYTEVVLHPLSEAESNELVERLLHICELPERLRDSIIEKSAGNPFFIEEVVRALMEGGHVVPEDRVEDGQTRRYWRAAGDDATIAIPDTLQLLLAARMDRLEEATRGTLQMASVIGRSFFHRVLQAVDEVSPDLDKRLGTLMRLDMIREAARVPEVEYAFRNPLTQEAVYQTILLKRRREFHRRVGEAIEALYAGRLEGLLGLLAHHFALAGERAKAIDYSRQAARQAVGLYAYEDAVRTLRGALDLLPAEEQSDRRLALLEELGDVFRLLRDGAEAIEQYQRALAVHAVLPEAGPYAGLRLHRKIVQVVTELKWSVGLDRLRQANTSRLAARAALIAQLAALAGAPPHPETLGALVALSVDAWRIEEPADWEAAQRYAEQAVDMADALDDPGDRSRALGALATVLDGRSRLREHAAAADRRLALARAPEFEDVLERLDALRAAGAARMYLGDYEAALPFLREAEELAAHAHIIEQRANALGLQMQCFYRLDRWDEALETEPKWRDLERRYSRERVGETCFFVALAGSIHALRGDRERARAYAQEAYDWMVSMSGEPDQWQRNQFY
jgi:hypothetical protein